MIDEILIPTDGSKDAEKGADHGVEMAAALGARVHALYVIEEGGNPWKSEPMEDQLEQAREYGEEVTGVIADQAADAGVECVTAVETNPEVYEAINEYAEEEEVDLIVMGSGYRGRIGGLLGSTANKVLRSAEVPVTTIRRGNVD